jgi:5-methyltetrahydrofolate--homocysteine methyltransferase
MESEKAEGGASSQGKIVLATVKGDVHDIGKNIVGVVLGCNNYEVVDLGVMVPTDKILDAVAREGAHVLGLSGLITPSLDEMVSVASEMKRRGLSIPLLIGGATTSRQHTAVKIAPEYDAPIVHVLDASRAVNVVASVLDPKQREAFDRDNREEQARIRSAFAGRKPRELRSIEEARSRKAALTFDASTSPHPSFVGRRVEIRADLARIAKFIDWTFLFTAWELKGTFPEILTSPRYGAAARELFEHAKTLLARMIDESAVEARAVWGFWAAASEGDDVVLFDDEARTVERARFPMLRQQGSKAEGEPSRSLADFVAPRGVGPGDYVGAFAVTAGIGLDSLVARFEKELDDYHAILAKALADRLAEAWAELLHWEARRAWGYEAEGEPSADDLIAERYRGIRPAFGYPACPDHTDKRTLFALLDAESIGIGLTESCAMTPAASVSGLYFAHPEARYFMVGKIGRDQVVDYARRKGVSLAEAERWLSPSLGYEPERSS